MLIQFLIPQWDGEDDSVLKPLLDSIAIQQNIDFDDIGAIIVNDGSDTKLSKEFLASYPFQIQYLEKEHGGVSAARNYALDHSTADYVMFCDADDMFYNACGLWIISQEIENGGFDTMTSIFIEETRFNGDVSYIQREMDSTFVHGKIHRRKYLLKNKIRFNDSLTIHEDSYFNILCQTLTQRAKYCQAPFYLWKWRDSSICRHDPKYILKTYNNMLDSNDALVNELLRRGLGEQAKVYCNMMVFDAYYTMNKLEWVNQENKEYRDSTEKRFKEYFLAHEALWDDTPDQQKMQISASVRNRSVQEGMPMESITIGDWLAHVKEI